MPGGEYVEHIMVRGAFDRLIVSYDHIEYYATQHQPCGQPNYPVWRANKTQMHSRSKWTCDSSEVAALVTRGSQ